MRQRIRLSESDLHRIVKETVTQIISENQELENVKNDKIKNKKTSQQN